MNHLASPPVRVMVVDDDDALRESVCELLAEEGFRTMFAEDGSVALEKLRGAPEMPDVILLDLMMPEMNGWQFREAQLKDSTLARIPVVVMTARRDVDDVSADAILYKPIKLAELLEAIRRHGANGRRRGHPPPAEAARGSSAPRRRLTPSSSPSIRAEQIRQRLAELESSKPASEDPARERAATTEHGSGHVEVTAELTNARLRSEDRAQIAHLDSLIAQMPAPVAVLRGLELVFETANAPYLKLCDRAEIVGQPLARALPELARQGVDQIVLSVMRTGEPYVRREVSRRIDRDGRGVLRETFWNFTYAPLRSPAGAIERVIVLATDVTDHVLARRRVEQSEERFRRIVTQVRAGIAETGLTGRVILTNSHYRDLVGRSEEELSRLRLLDFTHPDDLASSEATFQKLLADGAPFEIEKRYVKPDGSIVWVQKTASRMEDEDGQPQGAAVVAIDITQRKYAEHALRESEERFRNMAEHAPVMVWVATRDGLCTYVSRSWYEFTGQADGAALGSGWLDPIHPEDREQARSAFKSSDALEPFRFEYRLRRSDGSYAWMLDSAAPLFGAEGEPGGFIGSVLDISAQRLVSQEREARVLEMENAVRFSEMFIGMLGHDLRNPLSAITTAAQLLEGRAHTEKITAPVRRIVTSADRMERMISQLLDFTRIRLGPGLPLQRSRVDLGALCRATIEELAPVHGRNMQLIVRGDPIGAWDGDRLLQLVSNLAANACQHGTPGTAVVIVVDGSDRATVRVSVESRGLIPSETLPVIFEPLRYVGERRTRTKGSSGLGLGLYITRQVTVAHGGDIRVESLDGRSTRFVVELPRTRSGSDAPPFDMSEATLGNDVKEEDASDSTA